MDLSIPRNGRRRAAANLADRAATEAARHAVGERRRLCPLPATPCRPRRCCWPDFRPPPARCRRCPPRACCCCAPAAGCCRFIGTNLLIMAFGYRSFAVGTAYAKTEAVQGAILAFFLLHEALRPLAVLGIAVGVGGVLVLSLAGRGLRAAGLLRATVQPAALCGLGAGTAFALTAICVKAANQTLGPGGGLEAIVRQAMVVLLVTNLLQTVMQGGYLALREPDQSRAALRKLAQLGLGGRALGLRLGLLVHRFRPGAGGAGALARAGGDGVHPAVRPLLPEGDAAPRRRGGRAGAGCRRRDPGSCRGRLVLPTRRGGLLVRNKAEALPIERPSGRQSLARTAHGAGAELVGAGSARHHRGGVRRRGAGGSGDAATVLVLVFGAYALVDGLFAILAARRAGAGAARPTGGCCCSKA